MVKGVAQNFMSLVQGDLRASRVRIWVLFALALLLSVPAYLLAPPGGLVVHWIAVACAAVAGLVVGVMGHRRLEASLKGEWNRWMRFAVSCQSVPEVHRKVRGRSGRNLPLLYAALLTLAWAAELGLLILAFFNPADQYLAVPVIAANGIVAGGMLGYYAMGARWYRTLSTSIRELVDEGELGVWGVI